MYGSGAYRPLHHPKPRRRDRRAGARSEHRNAALLEKLHGRRPGWRPPDEKRRALGRLLRRFRGPGAGVWLARAVFVGALALLGVGIYGTLGTADPRSYAEDPAGYEQLAEIVAAGCGGQSCGLGARLGTQIPSNEARRLFSRLRVRGVSYDADLQRMSFLGALGATSRVVFDATASLVVVAARAEHDALLARHAARSVVIDHGGGWRTLGDP